MYLKWRIFIGLIFAAKSIRYFASILPIGTSHFSTFYCVYYPTCSSGTVLPIMELLFVVPTIYFLFRTFYLGLPICTSDRYLPFLPTILYFPPVTTVCTSHLYFPSVSPIPTSHLYIPSLLDICTYYLLFLLVLDMSNYHFLMTICS